MMAKQSIPQRLPITERVTGVLTCLGADTFLSARKLPTGDLVAQGEIFLRYGITYLGKPQLSIVPDLVVADYGEMLVGETAWEFLMQSGHLYPRADVCGIRNDGEEDMQTLKLLDFDYPYDVFAYQQMTDWQPFAEVSALIAANASPFPERLREHLPCYDSFKAWLAA